MSTTEATRKMTGGAASDAERRASGWLAEQLRKRNREVEVEPVSVRISEIGTISIHCLLAVIGALIGLDIPLLGAAICLFTAFSFYMERSLGYAVIGLVLPRRATQNVISAPPSARIMDGVTTILCAGYDLPAPNPVNDTLINLTAGRVTIDRIAFWGGMVLAFFATMLRLAAADGAFADIIQMIASVILLGILASQVDRFFAGTPEPGPEGLSSCEAILAVIDEADENAPLNARAPLAVCFFGAESVQSKGAAAYFSSHQVGNHLMRPLIVNYLRGAGGKAALTAREGDLATLKMDGAADLDTEVDFETVRLSRLTSATVARRHGLRAVTVLDNNDDAIDLGLDLFDSATPKDPEFGSASPKDPGFGSEPQGDRDTEQRSRKSRGASSSLERARKFARTDDEDGDPEDA